MSDWDTYWDNDPGSEPGVSWTVRSTMNQRTHPDFDEFMSGYQNIWGDEPRWTSMLTYGWSTCRQPCLAPVVQIDTDAEGTVQITDQNIGLFTLLLHLLGLGMGWTDIASGLRSWRASHYRPNQHVILDYAIATAGAEGLTALEAFCGQHLYSQMGDALGLLRAFPNNSQPFGFSNEIERASRELAEQLTSSEDMNIEYDSLHLTSHVADSIKGIFGDFKIPRYQVTELRPDRHYRLHIDAYGGWAFALAQAMEGRPHEGGLPPDDAEVDVFVNPIGYIGSFMKGHESDRWFLTTSDRDLHSQLESHRWGNPPVNATPPSSSLPAIANSPLYGTPLTPEMGKELARFLPNEDAFDPLEDPPLEQMEILYKEDVNRCHFLVYWIGQEWSQDGRAWTRVDETWMEGFMVPAGNHYNACLAEMFKGGFLPLDEAPLNAMLEDSPILEVEPWAGALLVEIWDSLDLVPSIVARIAAMDEDSIVDPSALDTKDRDSLMFLRDTNWRRVVSSDEREALLALEHAVDGQCVTARELLEAIAFAY